MTRMSWHATNVHTSSSQINILQFTLRVLVQPPHLELLPLFAEGRDMLQQGTCVEVRPIVEKIVSLMTVPLVQGTLRYAYKIGEVPSDRSQKNAAEGATFAAAVLPMVAYCNPASAKIVTDNVKFGLFDAGTYPDYAAVRDALEATYPCLGITCAQVMPRHV